MSESAKTLMQAVLGLPEAEKLQIAEAVFASLEADDPALNDVIAERAAEHETGLAPGVPAEEFLAKLRADRAARR